MAAKKSSKSLSWVEKMYITPPGVVQQKSVQGFAAWLSALIPKDGCKLERTKGRFVTKDKY